MQDVGRCIAVYPEARKIMLGRQGRLLLSTVVPPLVLSALGIWKRGSRVGSKIGNIGVLVVWLILGIWGVLILPWVIFLIVRKPIVQVNEQGISYRMPPFFSPFISTLALPWEQIAALYVERAGQGDEHMLCVLPRDVDAFLEGVHWLNLPLMSLCLTGFGAPVAIPAGLLPLTVEELHAQICHQFQEQFERYAISAHELRMFPSIEPVETPGIDASLGSF
uniref:Uncharacterized protein n=1 Tax=Thermosporothrix sp. COM3 TaxID=2490863 RepID=A0A455SVB7_9CHLR|nr:hypothetical protein KTC_58100 [Thermosporothrix sp. COM3]